MADKRPIALYSGQLEELRQGDTLPGSAGGLSALWASGGRLTLESGAAVSTTDQTAKTNLYFTPYNGNQIALYTGSAWTLKSFSELTKSLTGTNANTNYDVFIWDNAGTLELELAAWTNDTTRATALVLQDGIYVKTGALTRRYLGTIRTTATAGQCSDRGTGSVVQRFVWNMYNRVRTRNSTFMSSGSWTYAATAYRLRNNSSIFKHEFVFGIGLYSLVTAEAHTLAAATAAQPWNGVGFNSLTPDLGNLSSLAYGSMTQTYGIQTALATGAAYLGAGYGYAAEVEACSSANTVTFYGGPTTPFMTEMER